MEIRADTNNLNKVPKVGDKFTVTQVSKGAIWFKIVLNKNGGIEMKCHAAECKKEAKYNILCDGLETQVCEFHKDIHKDHSNNFKIIQELK